MTMEITLTTHEVEDIIIKSIRDKFPGIIPGEIKVFVYGWETVVRVSQPAPETDDSTD